jgi:hypothetical protein
MLKLLPAVAISLVVFWLLFALYFTFTTHNGDISRPSYVKQIVRHNHLALCIFFSRYKHPIYKSRTTLVPKESGHNRFVKNTCKNKSIGTSAILRYTRIAIFWNSKMECSQIQSSRCFCNYLETLPCSAPDTSRRRATFTSQMRWLQ